MSSAASTPSNFGLVIIAIIAIMMVVRVRRVMNGTRISVGRTIGYSVWYLVFGALALSPSFFLPIPSEYLVVYPVMFAVAFMLAFELARRRVIFWKDADGFVYSRGGLPIYLIYIVGFVTRMAIGYAYFGANFLFSPPTLQAISGAAISATVASDLLLVTGIGLLFGRNMRVLRKYLSVKSGKETLEVTANEEEDNPSMPT